MKPLYLLLCLCLLCATNIAAQTWNCGDPTVNGGANVTATLSGGTFTISGAEQFLIQKKLVFTNFLYFCTV
jgi:hypothetical protein